MKKDFQDKLFHECCEFEEFRQCLTGIDDLVECPKKQIVLDDFERMMMDSLFFSPSHDILVNIEHQSTITDEIMGRNLRYHVNTRYKFKKLVQLHIFHTGRRTAPKYYEYDNQIYHFPFLHQTCEKNGMETFNRIKNNIKYNKTTPEDIFDLVWLPCFGNLVTDDIFLKEYIETVSKLKDNKFYKLLRMTAVGWADRLSKDDEIIDYLKERLNMMNMNSPEFRDFRATAIFEKKMEEKDKIIMKMDNALQEKDNALQEKDNEISQLKKHIAKIEGAK